MPSGDNVIGPLDGRRHLRRPTDEDPTWVEEAEGWCHKPAAYVDSEWDDAEKFYKTCDTCGARIVMVMVQSSPVKWRPFNRDRTRHTCRS